MYCAIFSNPPSDLLPTDFRGRIFEGSGFLMAAVGSTIVTFSYSG